jgi:hypothetical protein
MTMKPMTRFQKVRVRRVTLLQNETGHFDELGDQDLRDGEEMEAQWPDGVIESRFVVVEETIARKAWRIDGETVREKQAFLDVIHRGAKVRVPLRNSEILLRRI